MLSSLHVYVVYGPGDAAAIPGLLVPALKSQEGVGAITLGLINYLEPRALFSSELSGGIVEARDISAGRRGERLGFGEGINALFRALRPHPCFLILNPDAAPGPHLAARLLARFEAGRTGLIEARQWPCEHPKEYDPATGRTPWASGACMLAESDLFAELEGFDPGYFMYCEDVDLSWRAWLAGREVIYAPEACVTHWTGLLSYRDDRYYLEHFYGARNFLRLAYKFFGKKGERKALRWLKAAHYPSFFVRDVIADYRRIRPSVVPLEEAPKHPMIRITGYNQYHALRHDLAA